MLWARADAAPTTSVDFEPRRDGGGEHVESASPNGDHQHEHVFREVYLSDAVAISEETTHGTVTLELLERGLVMHMEKEEGLELARAFTALVRYLED